MAYFDHQKAKAIKDAEDKFNELKKHITSKDGEGKLNEFFLASVHINDMENKLKEQEGRLLEYQHFFAKLQKLLPKQFDMNTPIN